MQPDLDLSDLVYIKQRQWDVEYKGILKNIQKFKNAGNKYDFKQTQKDIDEQRKKTLRDLES